MKTTQDLYKYVAECRADIMAQFDAADFGGDADVMFEHVNDYALENICRDFVESVEAA